jgi:hypothetical protein
MLEYVISFSGQMIKPFRQFAIFGSIAPSGAVDFISKGWGGRVSNKEIALKSGYIYKLSHGDEVLADRGFLVSEELAAHGSKQSIVETTFL